MCVTVNDRFFRLLFLAKEKLTSVTSGMKQTMKNVSNFSAGCNIIEHRKRQILFEIFASIEIQSSGIFGGDR